MTLFSADLGYRGGDLPTLVAALETQELSMARSRERGGSSGDPDARLVSITSDES